jgi:predicted esterase
MALHYALTSQNIPAGVISLSGHMLKYTNPINLRKLPILLMHGLKDVSIK